MPITSFAIKKLHELCLSAVYVTYFLLTFDQSDLSLVVFKNQIDLNLEQVSDLLFLFFDVPGCSSINFALLNLPPTILVAVQVKKVL